VGLDISAYNPANEPATVFLLVKYEPLISVLFAQEYSTAALAVPIIVLGNAVATFFGYHGMLLEATNHTRTLLLRGIVVLTVNVILDVVLIPEFGIVGAAIGTSTALAVGTLLEVAATVWFEIDRLPLTGYHARYLTVGAFTGMVIWITPAILSQTGGLILDGLILALVYPLGCVFLRGLTREDAEIIQRAVDRLERETGFRAEFVVSLAHYGSGIRHEKV